MKRTLLTLGLAIGLALPLAAQNVPPTYVTQSASGTTTAIVYFATSPAQQCRIVQTVASSDLASANILLSTGVTPLTITKSNALGTTIDVAYTNGFTVGDICLIEKASGVITNMQIASFTGSTNIVFSGNIPQTLVGDQVYKLSTPVKFWVGVFTNRAMAGDAIFVGNRGRPVQVLVNGTSACSLDAITGRYE
ncbi:MAG: hypothetical protein ABFD89_05205 [Bryobacteraceae bacterium]